MNVSFFFVHLEILFPLCFFGHQFIFFARFIYFIVLSLTLRRRRRSRSVAAFRRSTVTLFFLHALQAHVRHGRFDGNVSAVWLSGSKTWCSNCSTLSADDDDVDADELCSSSWLPVDIDVVAGDKIPIVDMLWLVHSLIAEVTFK